MGARKYYFLKDYAPDGNTKKRLDQETKKEKNISRMQTNKPGKCKCTIKRPSDSFFFLFFFLSRSLFFSHEPCKVHKRMQKDAKCIDLDVGDGPDLWLECGLEIRGPQAHTSRLGRLYTLHYRISLSLFFFPEQILWRCSHEKKKKERKTCGDYAKDTWDSGVGE